MEIAGLAIGLREVIVVLIALVGVYIIYVVARMQWLKRDKLVAQPPLQREPGRFEDTSPTKLQPDQEEDLITFSPPRTRAPVEQTAWAPATPPDTRISAMLAEIELLRDEVDILRGELAALRQDMKHELGQMRATQGVAPIYGDAMQLAVAGYDPQAIAERCGIARAEAELVVALAKSPQG